MDRALMITPVKILLVRTMSIDLHIVLHISTNAVAVVTLLRFKVMLAMDRALLILPVINLMVRTSITIQECIVCCTTYQLILYAIHLSSTGNVGDGSCTDNYSCQYLVGTYNVSCMMSAD